MGSGRYCFSPLAEYSRYTCVDEDDDVLELLARTELSSSNCQIVLNLLSPMLFYANWDVLLFCSLRVVFSSSPNATACRSAICSPLHATLNSSSLLLLHLLCLGDTIFVFVDPCFTRQGLLDKLSDSFSTFVFVWFDRSSTRSQRCTTRRTSSVIISLKFSKHGKSSWLSLQNSFCWETSTKEEVVL